MPRCYMVKKGNKYQIASSKDLWDQNEVDVNPESPTEGAVAPLCYTPLTNRPAKADRSPLINSGIQLHTQNVEYRSSSKSDYSNKEEMSIFSARSAEETEAAHDLLSLSQSLPPLPAPSVVMIHRTIPSEDDPPSPSHCYKPLAAENMTLEEDRGLPRHHSIAFPSDDSQDIEKHFNKISRSTKNVNITSVVHQDREPVIVENTTVIPTSVVVNRAQTYSIVQQSQNVVYVVQVPGENGGEIHLHDVPTPPVSECSSDVENTQFPLHDHLPNSPKTSQISSIETITLDDSPDLIVLPLSPEPDVPHIQGPKEFISAAGIIKSPQVNLAENQLSRMEIITFEQGSSKTVRESSKRTFSKSQISAEIDKPAEEISSLLQEKADSNEEDDHTTFQRNNQNNSGKSAILLMNIPDKRRKRRRQDNMGFETAADAENSSDVISSSESVKRVIRTSSGKTKFYKVVMEDVEDDDPEPEECEQRTKFCCSECGKCYATSSNLSRHKQTHRSLDSQSAKKCITCGKAYVSMPALAMHLLTHKLGHACGICGKHFSRPWLLQGHLRSHTGEKPYGCAHCGKAFADRSNLRAHMQTHSNEKRFECPNCFKTFALKSYLNKHLESTCINWMNLDKSIKKESVKKNAETQTITVDDTTYSIVVD